MKRIAFLLLSLLFIPLIKAEAIADPLRVDMHDPLEDGSIQVKHMDKIAELEEHNSHGKVGAEEYKGKLAAYKGHLITVKQNLRQFVE
jgi:hypothetical protein